MSYKSRSNYAIGQNISQERWDEIFAEKSKCCNAELKVEGYNSKNSITFYYICSKCGEAEETVCFRKNRDNCCSA